MKQVIKITLLTIFAFSFWACDDEEFLTENPMNQVTTRNYFQKPENFEQVLMGAYKPLQYTVSSTSLTSTTTGCLWAFSELRSDNTTFQWNEQKRADVFWQIDQFRSTGSNSLSSYTWSYLYGLIARAGSVIYNNEISDDYEGKAAIDSEARFLRAYGHFLLTQYYGDVPLITDLVTSYEEAFAKNKRVPREQVYDFIIEELNYAKENLPANYPQAQFGRASSGAARILLAKVLMWKGQYKQAAAELEAVVNSGEYQLLPDYASVFDVNNEQNREIIFSVQFLGDVRRDWISNVLMYRFAPWNMGDEYFGGGTLTQEQSFAGLNIPTQDLINSFEEGDLRMDMIDFSHIDHNNGTYNDSIVPFTKKFYDPNHDVRAVCGNDFIVFRYPHILLMLAECYQREGDGDPVALVNQVRARAGLPALSSVTLDDIIHERRVEFHCECDRWDVLVRTGKVKDVMAAHGRQEKQLRPFVHIGDAFQDIKILFALPDSEFQVDSTLFQNPEYVN